MGRKPQQKNCLNGCLVSNRKFIFLKISGFSFMRNTDKLYYPLAESIQSILPIVDEFIIALGKGDEDDRTEQIILSLNSDKIKIIHTEWNLGNHQGGTEYAKQTDIAKAACSGDWLFYIQSDEVIHERYLETIQKYCAYYIDKPEVEGFAFHYKHFFGDYDHYVECHSWYAEEIRIVRNNPFIHSWKDAQSFRIIHEAEVQNYYQKKNTRRLKAVLIPAEVYHYGWVRPPQSMQSKSLVMDKAYHDPAKVDREYSIKSLYYDYGDMQALEIFNDTHPKVMQSFITKFNWKAQLNYTKGHKPNRKLMKHEQMKYKIFTWIEKKILKKRILAYRNFTKLKDSLVSSNSKF